jgi:hypothetical protein
MKRLFVVLLVFVVVGASCNSTKKESVVPGTWSVSSVSFSGGDMSLELMNAIRELGMSVQYTFNTDSTYTMRSSISTHAGFGRWSYIEDTELLIMTPNGEQPMRTKLSIKSENNLVLQIENKGTLLDYKLTRKSK